jgi:hypothetical protein
MWIITYGSLNKKDAQGGRFDDARAKTFSSFAIWHIEYPKMFIDHNALDH